MSALGVGRSMAGRVTPGEVRPGAPAPALGPNSGQHSGMTRIQDRGQLSTLILGTKLDGKTLSEQNQGCPQSFPSTLVITEALFPGRRPAAAEPTPLSSLISLSFQPHRTHIPSGVSSLMPLFCLECYSLPYSLCPPAHSFRFHFSPTTSRKSSLSHYLAGLNNKKFEFCMTGYKLGCLGLVT